MILGIEAIIGENIWVLGVALLFTFALIFTLLIKGNEKSFLVFLLFFAGFIAWAGLIPIWVLYLIFILFLIMVGYQISVRRRF